MGKTNLRHILLRERSQPQKAVLHDSLYDMCGIGKSIETEGREWLPGAGGEREWE